MKNCLRKRIENMDLVGARPYRRYSQEEEAKCQCMKESTSSCPWDQYLHVLETLNHDKHKDYSTLKEHCTSLSLASLSVQTEAIKTSQR